jgi:hypothetical protein
MRPPMLFAMNCNRGTAMPGRRFSPNGLFVFVLFMIGFAILLSMDKGYGPFSRAWPFLMLSLVISAALAICHHMWSERRDFEKVRRIESQGLYGVLPRKMRGWLFPR